MQKKPKTIQSVQRAIDILSCFHGTPIELGLGEISEMLSLNKSTVHGIISTLYANEYITQSSNGKYKLGSMFLTPLVDENNTKKIILKEKATSVMQQLADTYSGSVSVFWRDGNHLILLCRVTPATTRYQITIHDSIINPLHTSASGKLLLASFSDEELLTYLAQNPLMPVTQKTICSLDAFKENLAQIRQQGYSIEDEELGLGIFAVSFPIYDNQKELFAALSITGLTGFIKGNDKLIQDFARTAGYLSQLVFF